LKILVTFALENEFAPWRAMHKFRAGKWSDADAFFTEVGSAEVGVVLTGVGPKQAGLSASGVIWGESESIGLCISSGVAGALRPEYRIAQILAARTIYSEFSHADLQSNTLESSNALISFAEGCGATIVDRFYSADRVITKAKEKQSLGLTADAVEMESFEILLEAAAFGIPAIAIRAISDLSSQDLPLDMSEILTNEGKVSIPRVLGQVAMHPTALPELVKLGQQSSRAAEALAQFLERYIVFVSDRAAALENKAAAAT
jgi:nucleoside phosphorylase